MWEYGKTWLLMVGLITMCYLEISRAQNHRCIQDIIFIHTRHFSPRQVVADPLYIFEVQFMVFHDIYQ